MTHPYRMEEEAPFGFGTLESKGWRWPLQRVDLHVRLAGVHAHVLLEQHFRNPFDHEVEVTYVFPTPALGAVSSYLFAIDGEVTRGVLLERAEARAVYDAALAAGQAASTLEEDRPEVMTVRVGNLGPGSVAKVRIGLDLLLPILDDCAVLRLPLLVGARYVPGAPLGEAAAGLGTSGDTWDAPDASRVTPPIAAEDPGVRVGVLVEASGVTDVIATHPLVRFEQGEHRLRLGLAGLVPDGDVVLRFPLLAREQALFVPDPEGGEGTLVVTTCSRLEDASPPIDVVVVLDRSGSMEGGKLTVARRAAAEIVNSLTPRDRLLVMSFDHELELPLGTSLIHATASRRRCAGEYFRQVSARGGTELAPPLQIAVQALGEAGAKGAPSSARRRVIVLVTDGQVGNEDQLVALVRGAHAEILAVAIGAAANQGLCQRLASVSGGGYEAAESPEQLGAALDRIVRRLLAPALEELELVVEGATVVNPSRAPQVPARAIPGGPAVTAARVRGTPTSVALRARDQRGKRVVQALVVEQVDTPSLARVWARLRLRDLEDECASLPFPTCVEREDELVATSLRFGVLSRFTAFVAVDPRRPATPPSSRPRALVQPVAAERSFGPSSSRTQAGAVRGKCAYFAPEQCRGLPLAQAVDVFSLSVVLYELVALRRLFRAEGDFESMRAILACKVPPMAPALASFEKILRRALVVDPGARPSAAELASAFAALPSERSELRVLAAAHAPRRAHPGPVAARSRGWWITERLSFGTRGVTFAATYAGPLTDPLPDAIVRLRLADEERTGDPLPVQHPNIARVLGVAAAPQRVHVIESIAGSELRPIMRACAGERGPLSLGALAAICADAAAAVAAVHARGGLLATIDPQSFILSTAGSCVLVDHALAPPGTALPGLPVPVRGLGRFLA